jgi:hypothetical protein
LAFTILAALTSSSFAQSVGEKSGVNSALGIAPKTEDFTPCRTFIANLAPYVVPDAFVHRSSANTPTVCWQRSPDVRKLVARPGSRLLRRAEIAFLPNDGDDALNKRG